MRKVDFAVRALSGVSLLALVFALGTASSPAAAAGEDADSDWGYRITYELMSPYCPGRTLAACPSPQAADLREWILDQEKAGRTPAEVKAELYAKFGEVLRTAPLPTGGGQWAYLIPLLVFIVGAVIIVFFLRRGAAAKREGQGEPPAEGSPDPELARIVDDEIGTELQ